MLLGESGCGKSEALLIAKRVVAEAKALVPTLVVGDDAASSSARGWMLKWQKHQADMQLDTLEGVEFCDEVSGMLTKRTGTETVSQWFIKSLGHGNVEDTVGYLGHTCVLGCTISFGFGSPVGTLRDALDIESFKGGLMHRFFFAHETELDESRAERIFDETAPARLAQAAVSIRGSAPPEMRLTRKAEDSLHTLKVQACSYRPAMRALCGFWKRYPGILIKLSNLLSLSEGRDAIDRDTLLRAHRFVRDHLYLPLEKLVVELGAGPQKRPLFRAVEDFEMHKERGLSAAEFLLRLESISGRQLKDMMRAADKMGLGWQSKDGQRLYASKEWRDVGESRRKEAGRGHAVGPAEDDRSHDGPP
jgi:hypothetical protein